MTINVDLRRLPDPNQPGHDVDPPFPYGCADCGQWFAFARDLVLHLCEERDYA